MNPFKQHPYLVAVFGLFFIMLILFSLSYCGGQTDAKMDASKSIIKDTEKARKQVEKRNKYLEDKDTRQTEELNETKQRLELLIYKHEQLKKKGIVVPKRNFDNVSGDSLYRIWKGQLEGQH